MANPKDINWYDKNGVLTAAASAGGFGSTSIRKQVAFNGGAGSGAVGPITLFTVTGPNIVQLTAVCTENLASAGGGTISVGTAASVAGIIAVTTATDIDSGDIWYAAAPATVLDTLANSLLSVVVGDGADIIADVLVGDITGGAMVFHAFCTPLSAASSVVAA